VKVVAVARIRAIIGAAFAVLGAAIAVRLLLTPEPFQQKILGLGFALVLIALGVVRVRGYLALRRVAP
jgi:hypothetical protein